MRTDLAIEAYGLDNAAKSAAVKTRQAGQLTITSINITTDDLSRLLQKPKGEYVTIEGLSLTDNFRDVREHIEETAKELSRLIPDEGLVMVAGLGNCAITPDALGPESTEHILATRHIKGELAKASGLDKLRAVSVISPGVLGQTGIETGEIISSLVKSTKPCAVIAIDALAARSLSRLGCTIQISNTGISPGSGVGNHRMRLDEESIGVPVIAVGIPTVVDAATLVYDLVSENDRASGLKLPENSDKMMVTPRETDIMIERAAKLTGMAINCALQKDYSFDTLAELVS